MSFDPGMKTGFAVFQDTVIEKFGVVSWEEEAFDFINEMEADIFVVEDFLIRKDILNHWNKGEPLQIIGAIKARARKLKSPVVLQQPNIKPVAYKWSNAEYVKGKKNQHYMDAVVHGNYYLIKNKLKLPGT